MVAVVGGEAVVEVVEVLVGSRDVTAVMLASDAGSALVDSSLLNATVTTVTVLSATIVALSFTCCQEIDSAEDEVAVSRVAKPANWPKQGMI